MKTNINIFPEKMGNHIDIVIGETGAGKTICMNDTITSRLLYHRAWQTGKANICDIAALLGKVEEASDTGQRLMPEGKYHEPK